MSSGSRAIKKNFYYLFSIFRLFTGIRDWTLVLRVFLNITPHDTKVIRLRESGAKFRIRGSMDIWSVKETFLDRFYEKHGTAVGEGWTIIDIGAGIGEFSLYAALDHPKNVIYAYEPYAESFALLLENLRLNETNNVKAFPEAIGAHTGRLALVSEGEPLQLQSHDVGTVPPLGKAQVVPSLSLGDAFARLGLERCDLLKLDCEGAEYSILFNASEAVLQRIERIVMEYHDDVTSYTHQDLVDFLTGKGFTVRIHPNFVHAYLGYLYAFRE